MSKISRIRLGDPLTSHGATYHVKDINELVEAAIDICAFQLTKQGILINDNDEIRIRKLVERQKRKYERMVERRGLPENIKSLIEAKSKREAERSGASITIKENDLFLIIRNSGQIGFTHRSKFQEFVPDHLKINQEGFPRTERDFKKVFSIYQSRKLVQVHLLEKKEIWHCFFFTYNDIEEQGDNHWAKGAHIHYISHLWPGLNPTEVWNSFDKRKTNIPRGIHIKFLPYEFPPKTQVSGAALDHIFPTNQPLNSYFPAPVALLTTRGTWIASYSFY